MAQTVTLKIKLLPTKQQELLLKSMSRCYISVINELVEEMVKDKKTTRKTTKHVNAPLPSAVKNQAIKDAKSVFKKVRKDNYQRIPLLKKPACIWNNQNYSIGEKSIHLPLFVGGKSKRTKIQAMIFDERDYLKGKLGTLRITQKNGKWYAQISSTIQTQQKEGRSVMGVDLGLKVPAVATIEKGTTRFFGNGRQNKFVKRNFRSKRKVLGQKKKPSAILTLNDKEQRWMRDQDHKISRSIVNFAIEQNISVIRLEKLANIRQTARTSRKNEKNLHTWSFYRLALFIEYKAELAGLTVEYVNPSYTSQTCPDCKKRNKAKDRIYKCQCGFKKHRDIVGAMNIRYAPVIDGHSQSA